MHGWEPQLDRFLAKWGNVLQASDVILASRLMDASDLSRTHFQCCDSHWMLVQT